jgi:hypothetical protein
MEGDNAVRRELFFKTGAFNHSATHPSKTI